MKNLFVCLAVLGLLCLGSLTGCRRNTPMPPNNGWQTQPSERNLLNEINAYRSQYGKTAEARQPVYTNGALSQAAQSHANYMAQTGNFSHRGEGRSTPATRASSFGYKWTAIAENIAWGQSSVQEAVRTWAGSFGHNRNMLGDFQHIGIGIAADQNGRIYWVTVFGNE